MVPSRESHLRLHGDKALSFHIEEDPGTTESGTDDDMMVPRSESFVKGTNEYTVAETHTTRKFMDEEAYHHSTEKGVKGENDASRNAMLDGMY